MGSGNWEVGLVLLAWSDIDRVVEGLTEDEAQKQWDGGSSFAWTFGHVSSQVDSWINVRFLGRDPDPLLSQPDFAYGGSGAARDWHTIRAAAIEVRKPARRFLLACTSDDLDRTVPYVGGHSAFRRHGLNLRMALLQIANHHMFHIGEIAAKRERLGHEIGDFPGAIVDVELDAG